MPNKIDIVLGAFEFIRISGITVNASPGEVSLCVKTLDDYAAELKSTLDIGYIQPIEYGQSDPNDYSGLTPEIAGPIKKLLALQIAPFFGKEIPAVLAKISSDGMRSLEHLLVTVGDMQNPATLPIGSGNEQNYQTNKFYPEPDNDDGAENYDVEDVFQLSIDWSSWLAGEFLLSSVTYKADNGISLTNEAIVDDISVVTVSFNLKGQFYLCASATNNNGDVKNIRKVYNATECSRISPYFP